MLEDYCGSSFEKSAFLPAGTVDEMKMEESYRRVGSVAEGVGDENIKTIHKIFSSMSFWAPWPGVALKL